MQKTLIFLFVFLLGVNSLFAQPLEPVSENKAPKKTKKAKKTKKGFSFDLQMDLVYDTNAYETPVDQFKDPESKATSTATPVSAYTVEPSLDLYWNGKALGQKYQIQWGTDVVSGYGHANAANLNQVDQQAEFLVQDGFKKKDLHHWHVAIFHKTSDNLYLHKATGATRLSATGADVSKRYSYFESGYEAGYNLHLSKRHNLNLDFRKSDKNYQEMPTAAYQSLDKTLAVWELTYAYPFKKSLLAEVTLTNLTEDYLNHTAYTILGKKAVGTDQVFVENQLEAKVKWKYGKDWLFIPTFAYIDRQDTYLGYWSYTETQMGAKIRYSLDKKQFLTGQYTLKDRNYNMDADPINFLIRTRTSTYASLRWDKTMDFGSAFVQVANRDQKDTDGYYSYQKAKVVVGVQGSFKGYKIYKGVKSLVGL